MKKPRIRKQSQYRHHHRLRKRSSTAAKKLVQSAVVMRKKVLLSPWPAVMAGIVKIACRDMLRRDWMSAMFMCLARSAVQQFRNEICDVRFRVKLSIDFWLEVLSVLSP